MDYLHKIQREKEELENGFEETGAYHWASHHKIYVDAFILFAVGIAVFMAFKTPFVRNLIIKSLKYIKDQGNTGAVLFILGSIVISLITSNCTLTNIAAGLLYGFKEGSIFTIINVYIIAIVAYFIGQKFMRKKIVKELNTDKHLALFKKIKDNEKNLTAFEKLEFIFLSRLPPVYPFQYISYFWGILNVKMEYYLLGTLGIIPPVLLETYMGSLLENIEELFSRKSNKQTHPVKIMIGTLVFSALISVLIGYLGKKTIDYRVSNIEARKNKENKIKQTIK
jgi:uncharacterized membrane protein YdjX (TVP38/TMEM64 family)